MCIYMCMCYSLRFYQYQGRQDTHTNTNIRTLYTSRALSFLGVEPQLNLWTKRVLRTRLIALTCDMFTYDMRVNNNLSHVRVLQTSILPSPGATRLVICLLPACKWRIYQEEDMTLEALPPRGGGSAGCPKKDKSRVRRGSREQKHTEHKNQSE